MSLRARFVWRPRVSLLLLFAPQMAEAHTGRALEPHDLLRAWTFAPLVTLGLALAAILYARGLQAMTTRGIRHRVVRTRAIACFVIALLALTLALVSPIDAVTDSLFSVHMVQHLLLVVVAAPLLILASPARVMTWGVPRQARPSIGRAWRRAHSLWKIAATPVTALTVHSAALWLWHIPRWYDLALSHDTIHILEHSAFFITALLFWSVALDTRRMNVGTATFLLFLAGLQCTLLGALIAMARHPLYHAHEATTQAWGFTPLEDQQLAGLIMWIPAGVAYLVAILPRWVKALSTEIKGSDPLISTRVSTS
jgi:putative membrane protein